MFRRTPQLPKEIPPVPPPRDRSEMAADPASPAELTSAMGGGDVSAPPPASRQDVMASVATGDRPSPESTDRPFFPPAAAPPMPPDGDRRPLTALPTTPAPESPVTKSQDSWTGQDSPLPAPATPRRATAAAGPRSVPPLEDVWVSDDIPYQPKELGVVDQLMVLLADGVAQWKRLLRWVRSQLPPNLQLSDEVLTAIALGLLILLLALGNPLGAKRGTNPAASNDPLPRLVAEQPGPGDSEPPAPLAPVAEPPAVDPAAAPPPPTPDPERRRIADIQERVSAISRSYAVGLIQSVEVDLPANILGVNLTEAWYGLLPSQQDDIAQDIYRQAQGLTFTTLQLRDPDGMVVARSPVVGDTMVVLRRLRSAEAS